VFFWDGDGAMDHDGAMRRFRLMGKEVIPAVHEIAKELELPGSFEVAPQPESPSIRPRRPPPALQATTRPNLA